MLLYELTADDLTPWVGAKVCIRSMRLVLRPPITICRRAHLKSKAVIASFNTASGAVPAANRSDLPGCGKWCAVATLKIPFYILEWTLASYYSVLQLSDD